MSNSNVDVNELRKQYEHVKSLNLKLDLTRGKPATEQLDLANALDGCLRQNYFDDGIDCRNYGGLDGLAKAKALGADLLSVPVDSVIVGGNSSLTMMYQAFYYYYCFGDGHLKPWKDQRIKFLCPVPGYDRHFSICEEFGVEMIPIEMTDDGPNMDVIEKLVKEDQQIKGIWCVPRFSNPSGHTYSNEVVKRIARLGLLASSDFRVFWDNAYAHHALTEDAPTLSAIEPFASEANCQDSILQFTSTSKITFAGSGLSFMSASCNNRKHFLKHLAISSIGPDKINQLRHLQLLPTIAAVKAHMKKHAKILRAKFECMELALSEELGEDFGCWSTPKGGYFVSFNTKAGLAKKVVQMANELGVKLTPAGATFPLGIDPDDCNIRLAPSYPSLAELKQAMEVFVLCVKLATIEQS